MADSYEILADELTVHKQVGELRDPQTGEITGIQQGAGQVYLKGEVIPASEVSPLVKDALENEDDPNHESMSRKIRAVSDEPRQNTALRLGVPFAGYDDMDEDEILAALRVLPSDTVQAIKHYEAELDEPRERIIHYNIGFGQSPTDREEGRLGSELDEEGRDNSVKAVADLTTREVPEEGIVQRGDGFTGTGDPQIPHGSRKEKDQQDEDEPLAGAGSSRRRNRRARPVHKDEGKGESSEGTSIDSTESNDE
jgi:hypothetical protein